MSDYLPFELQVQIIKRLPVKPVLQFRSVSKRWKALIDSSEFIAAHSVGHTQLNRLLVCSQGLLCLYDSYRDESLDKSGITMAVLWNPSIRKSVRIVVPGVLHWRFLHTVLGFGVSPITSDPTIVKITNLGMDMKSKASVEIEVFTLSTGIWSVPSSKLPDKPVSVTWSREAIDKFIYWFGYYPLDDYSDGLGENKLIMSFDMITQEISLIDLPNCFTHQSSSKFSISKVRGSHALVEYSTTNNEKQDCVVWMMNHGVPVSFTKLFTINTPYALINILGFMKSGGPIMETHDEFGEPTAFVFYEPGSKDFKYTSFYSDYGSFFVDSYMETLLLLDQPDSSVYPIVN
ncbi:unnamed protein product [Lactuca virosa]|uniref:F-box domain-containing protein n=1 Tax=Lactuca virosa TaxID=75947 RepID=A0AAU9NB00_9ASTR|nr:unnamed protein product [Lactuca virosa]